MALRFEEFNALRRRQQSAERVREQQRRDAEEEDEVADDLGAAEEEEEEEEEDVGAKGAGRRRPRPAPRTGPEAPPSLVPTFGSSNVGKFFETPEVQVVTMVLIFLDVTFSVASSLLTCQGGGRLPQGLVGTLLHLIEIFSGFTVFFFFLELAFLVVAFRRRFFTHPGNLVDLAVVGVCLVWELDGRSRGIRLLGVLRFWRLIRLVNTLIAFKDSKLQQTTDAWQADLQLLEESRVQAAQVEDSLRRELDARRRVEAMCRSYKDEVETLNEALKIAALDIAQAAGEQLESEDERGELTGAEKKPSAPPMIFVNEDGTFSVQSKGAAVRSSGAADQDGE